ncbi:hypothetical protein [Urbifossiella limnaea]|uniref:Uncharacterized protein n=1 Tax=Urbifossiella limnaea TaxID=2528023 RepID=A0A517XY18_9BACT|nr:hypothetical protein [Urbifossiella limnaea]QDU22402.1 hypothetical protein ETAA1_43820 [Urbifossiella limnaea]
MEKGLCYGALGVAALMLVVFLLDLVAGFPFGGSPFMLLDILGIISAGIIGYLAFNASQDLK